jgi:hypothetical protein
MKTEIITIDNIVISFRLFILVKITIFYSF